MEHLLQKRLLIITNKKYLLQLSIYNIKEKNIIEKMISKYIKIKIEIKRKISFSKLSSVTVSKLVFL